MRGRCELRKRISERGLCLLMTLMVLVFALVSCGVDEPTELAAVSLDDETFGAMLVSSDGEQLLPVVARNDSLEPTAVTGAVWMDGNGSSIVVDLDPGTGLPSKVVLGDYIILFANWNQDGTVADVARIYGPTEYIEILRGVQVREPEPQVETEAGVVASAATCLPNCPSKERTQAELLKVAGLGLSIATCGLATAASWGAMLLPCSGVVVSSAKMLTPEESWLNAPLERADKLLSGIDILQCITGDVSGCVSAALNRASSERQKAADREEAYQNLVQAANDRLMNGEIQSGYQEGGQPACIDYYACTPGLTLNCIEGGTKTCQEDCTWGKCPKMTGGTCSIPNEGQEACEAVVQDVIAQCAARGGHIVGWTISKADCVSDYNCWIKGCPCLMFCALQCGSDSSCAEGCILNSGANAEAESAACSACREPQVYGQCQSGG
ncbi:hypothetical protein KBA39_04410 [Myxococcota bacterium]|nr:hypothetical protein [Myxococcota bacterium]